MKKIYFIVLFQMVTMTTRSQMLNSVTNENGKVRLEEKTVRDSQGTELKVSKVFSYDNHGLLLDSAMVSISSVSECKRRENILNRFGKSSHVSMQNDVVRKSYIADDGSVGYRNSGMKVLVTVVDTVCVKDYFYKHAHILRYLYYDIAADNKIRLSGCTVGNDVIAALSIDVFDKRTPTTAQGKESREAMPSIQ